MSPTRPKLSVKIAPDPSEQELLFAQQLGVDGVYTWVDELQCSEGYLTALRQRVEAAGLTLFNVGHMEVAKSDQIHLALPGRDEVIAQFKAFVRSLGQAGIHVTTFTWEPQGVWSSAPGETRGAVTRRVNLGELQRRTLPYGRLYREDEIWENFRYFMREILPVAEEAGVRLALHPNDPPTPLLGGVPCLIHSYADYRQAFEIADSPYLGMEFCTGCWLEGGADFGDMLEAIPALQAEGRILVVHFRNVSAPLPTFVETFLDNGYMDMYEVMQAFCAAGYEGPMTLDHTPRFAEPYAAGAGTAYAIGYMRALMERALA
jgi:mannonate dehydratase